MISVRVVFRFAYMGSIKSLIINIDNRSGWMLLSIKFCFRSVTKLKHHVIDETDGVQWICWCNQLRF